MKPSQLPFNQRITPEMNFLLAAARPFMSDDEGRGLRGLCASVRDWKGFAALVQRHRLPGLVFHNLDRFAADAIPPDLHRSLREQAGRNRIHELAAAAEIVRVNRLLRTGRIRGVFFKGPMLSMQLYGSLGLRHSRDLDILIAPEELDAAAQLLEANGYKLQGYNTLLTLRQRLAFTRWYQHFEYLNPASGCLLELHWKLFENPYYLLPGFERSALERAESMDNGGEALQVPCWTDNFLYLCAHGAHHGWFRLKWLTDIAACFRHPQARDWEAVAAEASRLGLERPLAQAAGLAGRLLAAPTPPPLKAVCSQRGSSTAPLVEAALGFILETEKQYYTEGQLNRVRLALYQTKLRKGWKFKLHTLLQTWIDEKDWAEFPLPDSLFFLYFFLRPFLWLRRYGLGKPRSSRRK